MRRTSLGYHGIREQSPKWSAFIVMVISCAATTPARAEDVALADGLARLAAGVVEVIKKEGGDLAVDVGDFVGAPRLKSAGGPGIALMLADALEAKGVAMREPAPFQLLGTFKTVDGRAAAGDAFNSVALRIEASVLDARDNELQKININVFGDAPLQIAGGTGSLPPAKEGQVSAEREDAKRAAVESPQAAVAGAEVRDAPKSLFGIEVLVNQKPRQPALQAGRAFVDLDKGEEYVVRLHNRAAFEAAVTLTVDGLSMFAFSEDGSFGSQVLIPPGRFVEIPGWYVRNGKTDAFEIGGYAESAASQKLVPSTSVGVITATFHEAIEGSGKDPKATKRGRQIGQAYKEEKRVVKPPIAVVSVRYDRGRGFEATRARKD